MNGGHYPAGPTSSNRHEGPISRHSLINFVHRHLVELVTAIYLTYIVLGTLIPFDFCWSAAFGQNRSVFGLGQDQSGLPDLLSNIGLYILLGALLYWSLVRTVGHPWLSILASAALAAVLSLAIESIQLLSPTRVSSAIDFAANVVGAFSGAALAYVCRGPERRLLTALSRELRTDTAGTLVRIYVALLVLGALAPYTPTFDVTRLTASVRASSIVPFAQSRQLAARAADATARGDLDEAAAHQRDRMHLWVRWTAEFLSFAILGLLLHHLLRSHYRFRLLAALALAFYLTALLAVALSLLQILILSRGFHGTDILMRTAGAVAGYLALPARSVRCGIGRLELTAPVSRLAKPALVVAVLLVTFSGLLPFAFEFDGSRAAARIASNEFLPFYSYYIGRFDRVCADFWGKALRYGFLALALWVCWAGRSSRSLERRALTVAAVALGLSIFIEACQLLLRARVTSLTDVIIAPLAAWIAAIAAQYAADFYNHTIAPSAVPAPAERHRMPGWSLTDALVGSLIPDEVPGKQPTPSSQGPQQPGSQE